MSLADSVIGRWAPILERVDLVGGSGGVFVVKLDGETVFDKKAEGSWAPAGDIESRLERRLGPPLPWRQ